jgi:hypothetical protein
MLGDIIADSRATSPGIRTYMDNVSFARLLRIMLHAISLNLGSLGIFCFFWSCMGFRTAAYAIVCLGSATAIVLASDSERRAGR